MTHMYVSVQMAHFHFPEVCVAMGIEHVSRPQPLIRGGAYLCLLYEVYLKTSARDKQFVIGKCMIKNHS